MIHLLIDENLPSSLAQLLPVRTTHATDLFTQATDAQLWEIARENNWILLTRDTDFFDRIMLEGPPPKVIWVRLGNIRKAALQEILVKLWPAIYDLLADSELIQIHPHALEALSRVQE